MPDQTPQRLPAGAYRATPIDRVFAAFRWRLAALLALTAPPHRPSAWSGRPADTGPTGLGVDDDERVRVGQLV